MRKFIKIGAICIVLLVIVISFLLSFLSKDDKDLSHIVYTAEETNTENDEVISSSEPISMTESDLFPNGLPQYISSEEFDSLMIDDTSTAEYNPSAVVDNHNLKETVKNILSAQNLSSCGVSEDLFNRAVDGEFYVSGAINMEIKGGISPDGYFFMIFDNSYLVEGTIIDSKIVNLELKELGW